MTFQTMQDRLNDRIAGWGGATFPTNREKRYLNDGLTEFARMTHILQKQDTVTLTANTALFAFPIATGVASVLRVWRAAWNGKVLTPRDTRWMDTHYGTGWRDATGPDLTCILTDSEDRTKIRVYPKIDTAANLAGKSLVLEYSYLPSELAAPADECPLSEYYARAPIEYAVWSALRDAVQSKQSIGWAQEARTEFLRLAGAARAEVNRGMFHEWNAHVAPSIYER
jgi:hypothetical protein